MISDEGGGVVVDIAGSQYDSSKSWTISQRSGSSWNYFSGLLGKVYKKGRMKTGQPLFISGCIQAGACSLVA